jgi:hypothetical protein
MWHWRNPEDRHHAHHASYLLAICLGSRLRHWLTTVPQAPNVLRAELEASTLCQMFVRRQYQHKSAPAYRPNELGLH